MSEIYSDDEYDENDYYYPDELQYIDQNEGSVAEEIVSENAVMDDSRCFCSRKIHGLK